MLIVFKEFRGSKGMIAEACGDSEPLCWSRIWSIRRRSIRAFLDKCRVASLWVLPINLEQAVDEKIDQHEVARYLGVSTRTVRGFIARGELPRPIRIGRKQFWLKAEFSRWLHDSSAGAARIRLLATRRT